MFSESVTLLYKSFAKKYNFSISPKQVNYVLLTGNKFDIVTSYDDREDELFVGFDLSKHSKSKKQSIGLMFPVLLDVEVVRNDLDISDPDLEDNIDLSLEDRITIKYKRFEKIWIELLKHNNYTDILFNALINERKKFQSIKKEEYFNASLKKARDLFKNHEYQKVINLLKPFQERLTKHDNKILEYAIKKMK